MESLDYSAFRHIAILLLGGSGTRFGASKPKQFLPMAGKALCLYGAEALEASAAVDAIVYVVPKGYEPNFEYLLSRAGKKKPAAIIVGGASRSDSGKVAVSYLLAHGAKEDASVLLQDGDRPRLLERYLEENFAFADRFGSSVTAIPCTDSVAISKFPGTLDGYIPREEVWLLQTPQAFRLGLLSKAQSLLKEGERPYTDDASLVLSKCGVAPHIVLGERDNLKITTPADQKTFEKGQE